MFWAALGINLCVFCHCISGGARSRLVVACELVACAVLQLEVFARGVVVVRRLGGEGKSAGWARVRRGDCRCEVGCVQGANFFRSWESLCDLVLTCVCTAWVFCAGDLAVFAADAAPADRRDGAVSDLREEDSESVWRMSLCALRLATQCLRLLPPSSQTAPLDPVRYLRSRADLLHIRPSRATLVMHLLRAFVFGARSLLTGWTSIASRGPAAARSPSNTPRTGGSRGRTSRQDFPQLKEATIALLSTTIAAVARSGHQEFGVPSTSDPPTQQNPPGTRQARGLLRASRSSLGSETQTGGKVGLCLCVPLCVRSDRWPQSVFRGQLRSGWRRNVESWAKNF